MNLFMFWKNEQGEDELITAPLDGAATARSIPAGGAPSLPPFLTCDMAF